MRGAVGILNRADGSLLRWVRGNDAVGVKAGHAVMSLRGERQRLSTRPCGAPVTQGGVGFQVCHSVF